MNAALDLHLERVNARFRDLRLGLGRTRLARCLGELPIGFRLPSADTLRNCPDLLRLAQLRLCGALGGRGREVLRTFDLRAGRAGLSLSSFNLKIFSRKKKRRLWVLVV